MSTIDLQKISSALSCVLTRNLPRILSQVCRDKGNPAYGCFDRNWWHYKIRDFASIILQQGGYTLIQSAKAIDDSCISEEYAEETAKASCVFWNKQAQKYGAFEEYYPWEQGYPPLAFSSLCVAKLAHENVIPVENITSGLKIAAKQLISRFEPAAANQQVAGLAALAWIKKLLPELVSEENFETLKKQTLGLQTSEGWFREYDGPDAGYLSVTIDCLWDAYDATSDSTFISAAGNALEFIHKTTDISRTGPGMLNARNTDYIVPYGIARFITSGSEEQKHFAAAVLETFFRNTDSPNHFLHAVDDRYWCHYIGHSVARAVAELNKHSDCIKFHDTINADSLRLPECGYIMKRLEAGPVVSIALKKGGCIRVSENDKFAWDFGWIINHSGKIYISHWWTNRWHTEETEDGCTVTGHLPAHREPAASPFLHLMLRTASLLCGKSIISFLKKTMIFKKESFLYEFCRNIKYTSDGVEISDTISGLTGNEQISEAPRASKRHVASADSFNKEDASLINGFNLSRKTNICNNVFTAVTTIRSIK